MYPSASRTAMSLRTVALETPRLCRSTSVFEPIGSLLATKSATMARSTSKRRSSALPMCSPPFRSESPFILRASTGPIPRERFFAWRTGRLRLALQRDADASEIIAMIFKGVRDGRPYPDHGLSHRQWAQIPPRQIRLDELVTTTTVLALDRLLSEDSTFYGDLFPHAVRWKGIVYLEDGLHRAVRAALRNRTVLHARVFDMDMPLTQPT